LASGVSVEVASEKTEFAIGDPILLDIVYRNDGKETWEVEEKSAPVFCNEFYVRDAKGTTMPNPYDDVESSGPSFFSTRTHTLRPGATVIIRKYLNECVAFERPGEYVVAARAGNDHLESLWNTRLLEPGSRQRERRCPSKPLKVKILSAPDKKVRDATTSDIKCLWGHPELSKREEYARYRPYMTDDNGKSDALRLLVFRRDQELLPFWLELLGNDRVPFVWEGLAGLPDREAVVKATEERVNGPQRDRYLMLHVALAVPKTEDADWKEVNTRRDRMTAELSK